MFFLSYGDSGLGSWKDIMDMTPEMRKYFVERLERQQEEEKKRMDEAKNKK